MQQATDGAKLGTGGDAPSIPWWLACECHSVLSLWAYVSDSGPRKEGTDNWTGAAWEAGLPGSLDKQPRWIPVLKSGLIWDPDNPTARNETELCWGRNSDSGPQLPDDVSKTSGLLPGVGMAFSSSCLFCFCFPTHHCNVRAVYLQQHFELTYLYLPNADTDIVSMLRNFVGQRVPSSETVGRSLVSDS